MTVIFEDVPVTVIEPEPDFVGSACEVAVTVTNAGFGTAAGAVYNPEVEMVPSAAPPTTIQVTEVFVVPVTVAVNCAFWPVATLVALVETRTLTAGVTVPLPPQETTKDRTASSNSRK
jgi:hypothetical protein